MKSTILKKANMFKGSFFVEFLKISFTRPATSTLAQGVFILVSIVNVLILPAAAAPNSFVSTSDSVPSLTNAVIAPAISEQLTTSVKLATLVNFGSETVSPESRKLAEWVIDSADNGKLPFMIIDKVQARVFVFDATGQLRGSAAALLGLAVGDDSVPGIGQRKLSSIRPDERTTPAGRFVASLDRDINGHEVLWVDYESALSLHRVVTGLPKERRAERLATPSPADNRISFGCINVPVKFYEQVVSPSFTGTNGIVYILPETRLARDVFGSYDVHDTSRKQVSAIVVPVVNSVITEYPSRP